MINFDNDKILEHLELIFAFLIFVIVPVIVFVIINIGLTYLALWIVKGLFSLDFFDKFWQVFALSCLIVFWEGRKELWK